jgi:hypothetical protein
LTIANIKTVPAVFTFGKPAFEVGLLQVVPTSDKTAGATRFANAWEAGILTSTMVVSVGASINLPATPTNTYGPLNAGGSPYVIVTVITPASVITAKQQLINDIINVTPGVRADKFAAAFRNAFLALKYTTTGFDSTPYGNPPFPIPLANTDAPGE